MPRFKELLRKNYNYFLLIIFIATSSFSLIYHEPWRDEAQAWLIARDIMNPVGFLNQMRYEGTPPFWHLMLVDLNILNLPYLAMAIMHLVVISLAAFVFIKYSQFSKIQKALVLFGYFFIFEYNFIARNYAVSVLLLFAISALYIKRFDKRFWYLFFVGLLATTNSQSFVLASLLTLFYFYELIIKYREGNFIENIKVNFKKWILLAIPAGFILLSIYLTRVPSDLMPFYAAWNWNIFQPADFNRVANALTIAFVPIPKIQVDFWNTSIFTGSPVLKVIVGFIAYLSSVLVFRKSKKILVLYFLMTSSLLLFFLLKGPLSTRHIGFLFLSWIFCLSIYPNLKDLISKKSFDKLFIYSVLAMHILAGGFAVIYDIKYQFSGAHEAKDYLIRNNLPKKDVLIAAYPSYVAESLLPYLPNKTEFYYLEYQEFHSYMIWNNKYNDSLELNDDEVYERIQFVESDYKEVYFITNIKVSDERFLERFELVFEGDPVIITDEERYFIYKQKNLAPQYALK